MSNPMEKPMKMDDKERNPVTKDYSETRAKTEEVLKKHGEHRAGKKKKVPLDALRNDLYHRSRLGDDF